MLKKKFSILLFCTQPRYNEDGHDQFWCGGYLAWLGHNDYVRSFVDGHLTFTKDITEAKCFEDDAECDACMKALLEEGATNIPVWEFSYDANPIYREFRQRHRDVLMTVGRGIGLRDYSLEEVKHEYFVDMLKEGICCKALHYPNNHWIANDMLQPSLMNKTVAQWHEEHGINIE